MKQKFIYIALLAFVSCITYTNPEKKAKTEYYSDLIVPYDSQDSIEAREKDSYNKNVTASALEDLKSKCSMDYFMCDMTKESALKKLNLMYNQQLSIVKLKRDNNNDSLMLIELDKLTKKYNALQVKVFPMYRKAFYETMKEKLWIENVDVFISGSKNDRLTLVGGVYASNRNIQESYEAIKGMLYDLRFKTIGFRWYSGGSTTTYDIGPDNDNSPCLSLGNALEL